MFAVTASAQSWKEVTGSVPPGGIVTDGSADLAAPPAELQLGLEKSTMAQKVMAIHDKDLVDPSSVTADDIAVVQSYIDTYAPDGTVSMYVPSAPGKLQNPQLTGDGSYLDLNLPGQVQTYDNFCGPATAYAILKGRGINVTQSGIASLASVTPNGSGAVMSNLLAAMNSYNGSNGNNFHYAQLNGPGSYTTSWYNTMTSDAITTLLGDYGVAYNVHMINTPGSARLEGYETMQDSDIKHFVAGEGFDSRNTSSRMCLYYDSNDEKSNLGTRHMQVTFDTMARLCDDMNIGY